MHVQTQATSYNTLSACNNLWVTVQRLLAGSYVTHETKVRQLT